MTLQDYSKLPWNFEAFRSFISFEVLQQAASVLCLYDNQEFFENSYVLQKFEEDLSIRTGVEWLPKRNIDSDIIFNTEGNLFRNKARVFSSFYLIELESLINKSQLQITPICKALGTGRISKREFYNEIITRFAYPHPAYEDNWEKWREFDVSIKPFVFMLDILINLYEIAPIHAYYTVTEFAVFAHSNPFYNRTKEIAKNIIESRASEEKSDRKRSDEIDRKIGDLCGFLCMTGYAYYHGNKIYLNLIDVHPTEKVYFFEKRGVINTKIQIQNLIINGKK
jgi:hypothetical protein